MSLLRGSARMGIGWAPHWRPPLQPQLVTVHGGVGGRECGELGVQGHPGLGREKELQPHLCRNAKRNYY